VNRVWRWWRRKRQTSRLSKLLLDALRPLAAFAQALLAAVVATRTDPSPIAWLLAAVVFYVTLDRLFLTDLFKHKPLEEESARRAQRMATALNELARSLATERRSEAQIQQIESAALTIVRSEVQERVGVEDGAYLNVTLIVPDVRDPKWLVSINRADLVRPRRRYLRHTRLVTRVINENRGLTDNRYEPKGDEKYRSILMFPVPAPDGDRTLGAITIDSSLPDQFTDLDKKLSESCQPAIALLAICLDLRHKDDLWPIV
jgi:hypothetical protein